MQQTYSTNQLAGLLNARWVQSGIEGSINELLTDSRSLHQADTALFFAIKGPHHDGHDFIPALYESGVRHFVISRSLLWKDFPDANFYRAENVVRALQGIAAHHRRQFSIPVIGITGSNGKTIIKEWLFQLLREDYHICRSPKSYNSQVGVPLSVWRLQGNHELAIFEAGISQINEMQWLAPIVQPDIGIFTNIGEAHSEGFASRQQKLEEKLKLFEGVEKLIYCLDHEQIDQTIREKQLPGISWGASEAAHLQVLGKRRTEEATVVSCKWKKEGFSIEIPFTDEASVENVLHCCTLMKVLGCDTRWIKSRMKDLEPVAMRLETRAGINNCVLINDSYNADLTGLQAALSFVCRQYPRLPKTAILSDMLESGTGMEALYRTIAEMLKQYRFERVAGIGKEIRRLEEELPETTRFFHFETTESFLEQQSHRDFRSEVILIKGARRFAFERIAQRLSEKVHQTQLEVNINALIHNIRVYQRHLKPETKMMIMVKAAAYGSGSLEVARALAFHKVDYLAVAYADEGVELREGGISLPIMVLNPEEAVFDTMLRYRLEPEVYSLRLLQQFGNYTQERKGPIAIHLKLDTGMHRLGFTEDQLPEALSILQAYPQLITKSVFSHLAASESSAHDPFTYRQLQRFRRIYKYIKAELGYRPERHILNSSGILRFSQYQMEMVRLGIGAYGMDNTGIVQPGLQSVLTLTARISQIKSLEAGETVGYGRAGKIEAPKRIATLSIGYADGLSRLAGQGAFRFLIHGKKAPTIGAVCMDMCMVDISHIPEAKEGDEALVFGSDWPASILAEALGTIPYEVFAAVSPRVRRVYVQE